MKRCLLLILVFIYTVVGANPVTAMDALQRGAFNKNILYFNTSNPTSSSCSATSTTPGGEITTGPLPIRLPQINDPEKLATTIDDYIKSSFPSSPLIGLGSSIVQGGMRAGINPLLAIGQARHESGFGTAADGWHATTPPSYNPLGRSATPSQPHTIYNGTILVYKYESWEKGFLSDTFPADGSTSQPDDWFQYIARKFEGKLDNIDAYINEYAPKSDGNDVDAYMDAMGKYAVEVAELSDGAIDMSKLGTGASVNCTADGEGGAAIDPNALVGNTASTECAAGTQTVDDNAKGWNEGKEYTIRICEVPNITSVDGRMRAKVNSVVSKSFLDLSTAAKAAGHSLVFNGAYSTFRTMEQQEFLCSDNPTSCAAGFTAQPGHSNHQMGLAIDFNFDGYGTGSDAAGGRCKIAKPQKKRCELGESATWSWMKDNAAQHGFKQLWFEFWHWGALENDVPQ